MAEKGVAFRATSGYVTDGANDSFTPVGTGVGSGGYPTTLGNGLTAGYEISSGNVDARDRNSGIDVRIAGLHFNATSTTANRYRIDLLDGTGDYDIRMGLGDDSGATTDDYVQFLDDSTVLGTVNDTDGHPTSQWYDATGVLRTSASNWASGNARARYTFASTIFKATLGRGASSAGITKIAYLSVEKVASGGGGATLVTRKSLLGVGI